MEKLTGKKLNMTRVFLEGGRVVPVTYVVLDGIPRDQSEVEMVGRGVEICGFSKGRGFAGGMKRYGFKGGPATRGQSTFPRQAGSIGSQTPGRVRKGKKMAGHYGNKKVTVKGLKVVNFEKDTLKLAISGPIPGARNSKISLRFI